MDSKFKYTYSALTEGERQEIENIRSGYAPSKKHLSDLERLRKLNKMVNRPPKILAWVIGIVGLFTFGFGLTCGLQWQYYVLSVIFASSGIGLMIADYFIYRVYLRHLKRRHSQEILALSDKLLSPSDVENE